MMKSMAWFLVMVIILSMVGCDVPFASGEHTTAKSDVTQATQSTTEQADPSGGEKFSGVIKNYEMMLTWAGHSTNSTVWQSALNAEALEQSREHQPIFKCDTLEELNAFKDAFSGILSMDYVWNGMQPFRDITFSMDDAFFKENSLLVIYIPTISGSYRFDVSSFIVEDGALCVYIDQTNPGPAFDEELSGFMLVITVSKDQLQGVDSYDAYWDGEI